jgi:hypothetical protein
LDTGNNTIYDQFFGNDDKYLKLEAGATGNIVISTDGTYEWQFGSDGNLTLPGNITLPQGSIIGDTSEIVSVTVDQLTSISAWTGTLVFTKVSDTLYQALPSGPTMTLVGSDWKLAVGVSVYYESLDLITWTALGGALPAPVGTPEILEKMNLTVTDKVWTLDDNGNITLPTNSSNINYANGTSILSGLGAGGGGLPLSNGNSIINIASVDGNITLDADGNIFTLGTDGNLTTPSSLVIGSRPGGGSHIQQNDAALDIIGEGSSAGVQLGWAANLSTPGNVALIAMNSIVGEGAGNIVIAVGNNATTVHSWLFGNNGNLKLPAGGDIVDSTGTSVLGSGIALTDLSIGTDGTPTGGGNISYVNTTGVFTYTPPVIPDVSGFALTTDIPDVSGFVTGTPWTSAGYLTTITNIFNQNLNTSNNVTFNSVITNNVLGTNGSLVTVAGGPGTSIPNSIVFDGSTSFMSVPASSDFAIGVTYTIEFRIYLTATSVGLGPWIIMTQEASDLRIHLLISSGKFQWNTSSGNSQRITEPTAGQWVHVALVNTAGTQTIYYDGIEQISLNAQDGTPGYADLTNATAPLVFGRYGSNNYQYLPAKLSGIRISKVARYPAAFTPPTEVFVSDSNTLLLMNVLASQEYVDSSSYARTITNTATTIGTIPGIGLLPGNLVASAGSQSWTFSTDGNLTLPNSATIIAPSSNDLTVRVTGQYNICTVVNAGTGYAAGNSTSLVTGGSGTGMVVGYGYGLSGQIVSVSVTTAGTGYLEGEVLTMSAGDGTATFVITKYNSTANPNTNTAPSDWIFGTTNNLTLPLGGDIKDSTGTSVLFSGDYTDLSNKPTIPAAQIQSDWTQATNTALDYIKNKPTILAEPAFSVQTTDFNATAGSRYGYNTTAGVVTATLPASPSAGDAIYFADASGTTSTNNFIIARNSQTIMGSASNMTVNVNDQSFGLFYNGTTWRVY